MHLVTQNPALCQVFLSVERGDLGILQAIGIQDSEVKEVRQGVDKCTRIYIIILFFSSDRILSPYVLKEIEEMFIKYLLNKMFNRPSEVYQGLFYNNLCN